jgi:transcriptional regulator NrdR family protein
LRRRRVCPSCRTKVTTAEILVAQDWSKGVRTKGPVVAIRKRDLRRIVELASAALGGRDLADDPETPGEEPAEEPAPADQGIL